MTIHRTFGPSPPTITGSPDLALLDDIVAKRILHAMHVASEQIAHARVRYALIGGLAVGAQGYPRATTDVDFLLGPEAFPVHGGGIVTIAPGIPISVGGITIDPISIAKKDEVQLLRAIEESTTTHGIPVLPLSTLVYLKLRVSRKKDVADITELVKRGLDVDATREYIQRYGADLLSKFDRIVHEAAEEPE